MCSNKTTPSLPLALPCPQPEPEPEVKEVWASNLYEEFIIIRKLVREGYTSVSVDTEFPGIVLKPGSNDGQSKFKWTDFQYETLRLNVNSLKLIQLGLTFMNSDGKRPEKCSTWQFNFKFNKDRDDCAAESMELLIKAGIPFEALKTQGIDPIEFGELFIGSGLVFSEDITWISFHGGYDFAYMLKYLLGRTLPETDTEFFELLKMVFPVFVDVKHIWATVQLLRSRSGGLQSIASQLGIQRVGKEHQAGSDSLITAKVFTWTKDWFDSKGKDCKWLYGYLFLLGNIYAGAGTDLNRYFEETNIP